MKYMSTRFEQVKVKATKKWIDGDGKKRQRTCSFSQTLNPFNKNGDGSIKTREQIMAEICFQRDQWLSVGWEFDK